MRQKSIRLTSSEKWKALSQVLELFGARKDDNELLINWQDPDYQQFNFLLQAFSKLTGSKVIGSYSQFEKAWRVFSN